MIDFSNPDIGASAESIGLAINRQERLFAVDRGFANRLQVRP
jgi:hypothetical protein